MQEHISKDADLIKPWGGIVCPGQLGHDKETGLKVYRFSNIVENQCAWVFVYNAPIPFALPNYLYKWFTEEDIEALTKMVGIENKKTVNA